MKLEATQFPDGVPGGCAVMRCSKTLQVFCSGEPGIIGSVRSFDFGHAKFEMPIRHPSGEMMLAVRYTILGFREVRAGD